MAAASRPPRPPSRHVDASDAPEDFSSLTRWTTTNSDLQFNPAEHTDPSWRPDHLDDPIAERARRRSQIAEPAGTGEFAVGGWAGVPRMRLGGSDPLGGPDRGRAGVEWGTAHFERTLGESLVVDPAATTKTVAHRDGGAVEDMLATVARDAWSGPHDRCRCLSPAWHGAQSRRVPRVKPREPSRAALWAARRPRRGPHGRPETLYIVSKVY